MVAADTQAEGVAVAADTQAAVEVVDQLEVVAVLLTSAVALECVRRLAEAARLRCRVADLRRPSIAHPRSVSLTSADRRARSNPRSIREREHNWGRVRQELCSVA